MPASVVRFRGSTFLVPEYAAHVPVASKILDRRLVSPRLHRLVGAAMARRPGSMVHAGTFFGDMLASFSRKTPGTVYAFEPVLENYLFAQATVDANQLDNVLLLRAGIGAEVGVARIETQHANGKHRGGASYFVQAGDPPEPNNAQLVPVLTLDQFAIPDLSLIQLDVEGFEVHVLRGAADTIAAQRPVIVVEDKKGLCVDHLAEIGYVEVRKLGEDHVYVTAEDADAFVVAWDGFGSE